MKLRVDMLTSSWLSHANNQAAGGPSMHDTALVVDVIRATTSALVCFERGAKRLLLCPNIETAKTMRKNRKAILIGERSGIKPDSFDYGNSPLELAQADLLGKTIAMTTTNGTNAAVAVSVSAQHTMLACLRNAHACARKAKELASEEISIICAGANGQVGLDDVYTAGVLAEYLLAMGDMALDDGARVALTVRRAYSDPREPLQISKAAEALVAVGLGDDVGYCAQISESSLVPFFTERIGESAAFATEI